MAKSHRVYFTFMGANWSAEAESFDALQRFIEREGFVPDLSAYQYELRQVKRVPAGRTALPLVGQELRMEG